MMRCDIKNAEILYIAHWSGHFDWGWRWHSSDVEIVCKVESTTIVLHASSYTAGTIKRYFSVGDRLDCTVEINSHFRHVCYPGTEQDVIAPNGKPIEIRTYSFDIIRKTLKRIVC